MFLNNLTKNELENKENVTVFHCMGGKGRTGTIASMYLLHKKICKNAEQAMKYFALKRTFGDPNSKFEGVETNSQKRFVNYYDIIVNKLNGNLPDEIENLQLDKIVLRNYGNIFSSCYKAEMNLKLKLTIS